jgi:plasmid stability protein
LAQQGLVNGRAGKQWINWEILAAILANVVDLRQKNTGVKLASVSASLHTVQIVMILADVEHAALNQELVHGRVEIRVVLHVAYVSSLTPCPSHLHRHLRWRMMQSMIASGGVMATNLVVRNVDEDVALALKQRAAANGRSAEAEHREILKAALKRPRRRTVVDVLASMPDVGEDADFDARKG